MSLAALIRSGGIAKPANANPADSANGEIERTGLLARLATLALANTTGPDADDWQEFESLLAVVGPAYQTPAHEYALIREAAQRDLPAALDSYRDMAKQIEAIR